MLSPEHQCSRMSKITYDNSGSQRVEGQITDVAESDINHT